MPAQTTSQGAKSAMLTTISDRELIGGPLYFEIQVNELTPSDLGHLGTEPKRNLVKIKLYNDDLEIPICNDESKKMKNANIHPSMQSQAYCLCEHLEDGLIAHFRGVVSHEYIHDGGSLDLLVDEIRPRLVYQLSEDHGLSIYQLLNKLKDIQYHIAIK